MSVSPWLVSLKETLKMQGTPVIEFGNSSKVTDILSAANLWTRALERKRILMSQGFQPTDILCELSSSKDFLVNFIACNMAGGCFFPLKQSCYADLSTNKGNDFKVFIWKNQELVTGYLSIAESSQILVARQDSLLLLKTSGTTGAAKYVGISGDALLHQVKSLASALDLQPEQGRLIVLPLHHCFGLILDLLVGLFSKQTLFIRSHVKFEPSVIFDLLRQEEIQHISLVPRMVELLVLHAEQNPNEAYLLSSLHIHVGGATITETLRRKAKVFFAGWIEGYGLTECSGAVLLDGRPNNCEVKLKPTTESNGTGYFELWVKSPSIGKFVNPTGLDSEGFFNTEDLARQTSDQRIQVLNRAGDLIKTQKGIWVSLNAVQNKIQQQLQIEPIWICRQGHDIHVAIKPADQCKSGLIEDYLTSQLGIKVQIRLIETSQLLTILSHSQKKSAQDAVAEWISRI